MKRAIFEVYAKIVDSTGAYNTLSGYPKVYDSHQYNDDIDTARSNAYGAYHEVLGAMYKRTDRQIQFAMVIDASKGMVIESQTIGKLADLPDPTYAVTVTNGTGSGEYVEGAVVTSVANEPEEGKVFSEWSGAENLNFVDGGVNEPVSRFAMPAEVVAVEATYADATEGGEEE